jgi:hypothetical protein
MSLVDELFLRKVDPRVEYEKAVKRLHEATPLENEMRQVDLAYTVCPEVQARLEKEGFKVGTWADAWAEGSSDPRERQGPKTGSRVKW